MTNPVTVTLSSVAFPLQEPHDFGWLSELGEVFAVFDQQDSGNLSFGLMKDGKRSFVKYAGARPVDYQGNPNDAIRRLQQAVPVYEALEHEHLIRLVDHFRTPEGYAAVFDWAEGESLHPHWSYPPPAKYTHPESPFYRFRQLPLERRLASMDSILSFHVHAARQGYVAIDFYDGSLLYDFKTDTTKICDVDLYGTRPYVNEMGRMWGSSRFMAPEEFKLGAVIDEVTNVYNMGAAAFVLLGGERDRSLEKWEAEEHLYQVAARAVEPDRARRYGSLAELQAAWRQAGGLGDGSL
ncbi:serine/threonine-protein kinase [Paenibacillus sp. CC-CFT747]|nr:serine/threonine-protein kinase [Paenibacillus sp. CC-CFT747]